ncbi:hypothetical protein MTO96_002072 [Rhipicephalus appendiculatus]
MRPGAAFEKDRFEGCCCAVSSRTSTHVESSLVFTVSRIPPSLHLTLRPTLGTSFHVTEGVPIKAAPGLCFDSGPRSSSGDNMLTNPFHFVLQVGAWEGSWSAIFLSLTVAFAGLLTLRNLALKRKHKKDRCLPPGPRGIPLLGYLPFIWKPYHVAFKELSEKYGPIMRLQLGVKDMVVLNDVTSVREALTNPDLLYRPDDFIFNYLGVKGIAALNGEAWQVNRRYCFHVLRNLGFAKKSMEEHIHEEVTRFREFLTSGKGEPVRIAHPLASSVANNISALVFGQRYDLDDPKGRVFEELTQHVRNAVKEREENMNMYAERDFIDGYLRKIKENTGPDSHYTMKYLEGNAINFYGPGTNPVRTVILWILYIAASDPDGEQARVQREIDAVVGRRRLPEWKDREGERALARLLALMEIFLYVTTVLQKFKVLPEEKKTVSLDIKPALLMVVDDTQALRFVSR